ncbi:tetratricopeptide repeat protein [Tenacibaculum salmonis]|uniref:tetratricopeptide repeat protein n=1 Tax=Tenacibaculum sp. P3-BQ1 TaxID=3232310 RepID=UPI0034DDEAF1
MNAQNSVVPTMAISEKDNIAFQNDFFKALSQKALFNHKKAIEYLENCNQLRPNNEAVFFELSKNNLKLARSIEALEYIELALNIAPDNLWMLEHKITILKRIPDFKEAIKVQEKIAKTHPKKKQELVYLHLQNKDIVTAKKVLSELKEAKLLNPTLRRILKKINNKAVNVKKQPKKLVNTDLHAIFEKEKSFTSLKPLLIKLAVNKHPDLLKYSSQGLALFPAQPFVYLMNAKALNNNKQHKKALQSLQNGIDFVIDNPKIEAKFYLEMASAYKSLHNVKKANTFKNKAAKILK